MGITNCQGPGATRLDPNQHIVQREKPFSCRLSARHQCLKQATGRAGTDAPEIAKCLHHGLSSWCATCAGTAHTSSARLKASRCELKESRRVIYYRNPLWHSIL